VSPHLDAALELAPDERATWLLSLRAKDPALATSVEAWLAEIDAARRNGFLESADDVSPARSALAGLQLGAYRLVDPIGHGGMGSVWVAERNDGRFEGRVAVKLLNASLVGPSGDERFAHEGRILAKLTHPQIAHLIDAGVSSAGQPYLVLELVDGEPIDRYFDRRRMDVDARVRLFLDVLAPVAHAHANLVVHRDLKPSNVLITKDGRVKLLDFGIAKLLEPDRSGRPTLLTRDAGAALTPAYAAPEQLTGGAITTATDVYTLGVLAYVLLSGRHPAGETTAAPAALLEAIVHRDPPRLSVVAPAAFRRRVSGDLEIILAKALKKSPDERYPTVTAFADDLRRYLHDEPISARSDALIYTVAKFVRRNRTAVILAAFVLLALVGGLAGTLTQAQHAARQAAVAEQERSAATAQRDFARRQLSRAEAINELNEWVIMETAPRGTPLTARNLLARAERLIDHVRGGSDDSRVDMLVSIGRLYASLGETEKATRVLGQAYQVSRPLSDQSVRAKAACALGSAVVKTGDLTRARELVQEGMNELPTEPQYAMERIFCRLASANVSNWAGEGYVAVEHVQAAQSIATSANVVSVQVQLEIALELAEAYRNAGHLPKADRAFRTAHEQVVAQRRENTELAGALLNNWGLVLDQLGRPREAERMFRRKVEIGSAEGSDERIDPVVWLNLARSAIFLHRFDEAQSLAERAYAGATKGKAEIVATLSLLLQLRIQMVRGELTRSSAILAIVEPRLERVYPPGHVIFASLAAEQAALALALGDHETAVASSDRAVALAEASPHAPEFLPKTLIRRSAIALALGRAEAAAADASRALALEVAQAEGGSVSGYVGRAYLALGRALGAAGKSGDARAALTSALDHLEPTLGADHADTRSARTLLAHP
jgi:tetratricopeptide (TPR) repeat protein